jgi:hypothetical protein
MSRWPSRCDKAYPIQCFLERKELTQCTPITDILLHPLP